MGEAAEIAHRYGASLHCDAAGGGQGPRGFRCVGGDTLLTGHKFGPQGIGAPAVRTPDSANCFMRGGGQERGLRGGTESVAHIVALGRAAEVAVERRRVRAPNSRRMEGALFRRRRGCGFSAVMRSLPNTSKLMMPGVSPKRR